MPEFHMALSPGVMNDLNREIRVTFDEPENADRVEVTIWEADQWVVGGERISEGRRNRDDMIAQFRGAIVDGHFQGRVVRRGRAPRGAPTIRLRFDGSDEVHELRIASRGRETEGGVYEITASVRGRIGRRQKRYRTQSPVFIRQFLNQRPVVCFVTGSRGGFFAAAIGYWRRHCDVLSRLTNVEQILEYVRDAPTQYSYGVWGEVNIVSHGNSDEWIIQPFRPPRRRRRRGGTPHLALADLQNHARDQRWLPRPEAAQLDGESKVILRGCVMGTNQPLLDAVHSIFGGRATVYAPKYLQLYSTRSRPPREGFWEQFFISVPARNLPNNRRLAARFAREYPGQLDQAEANRWLRSKRSQRFQMGPFNFVWRGSPSRPTRDEARVELQTLFARADITPGPGPLRTGTEWEHFSWQIQIQRRGRGTYRAIARGTRWEVEIRRPLLVEGSDHDVTPDLQNEDHYGRAS
jgi:hypothetical protein